jgi:hypothetical protein
MMLKIQMPVEAGNEGIQTGSLPKTIKSLMEDLKPECAYFYPEGGKRAAMMVFDMADPSNIPLAVEPLLMNLNADVWLTPVMDAADLEKGLQALR